MAHLYVVGAGGHAKVVADAALLMGLWDQITLIDRCTEAYQVGPWAVVPEPDDLNDLKVQGTDFIVGMGDNALRVMLQKRFAAQGFHAVTVIHPTSVVSHHTKVAEGCFIAAQAVVQIDAKLGAGCIVNTAAVVEHDCVLQEGVQLAPGAILGGGVSVGGATLIGLQASVRMGCRLGRDVIVGMGAAVVKNIPDHSRVVGVPAKPL
ncbi:acetyltransferase [Magnetococcus sp. PR-3]|uniref:acetyltransferase n=1 Tax=Magnetococcus sp. PR-3 TaxID=3120355 RepID=UPI002FCDEDB2